MVTSYNNPLNPAETTLPTSGRQLVHDDDVRDADQGHRPRSHVAWGAVIAGSLMSLSLLVLFSAMAYTFGIPAYRGGEYGAGAAIWSVATSILAFFAGGCVATDMAPKYELRTGLAHGALAWVVALPLMFLIFGGAIGAFSLNVIHGFPNEVLRMTPPATPMTPSVDSSAAWGTLTALTLGLISAAIGGWVGATGKLTGLKLKA